jgi:nitrogen regulatory protein PII-like uncharacterized protein
VLRNPIPEGMGKYRQSGEIQMSNWSDKIVVIGVGISDEEAEKIKEIIIEKVDN